MEYNPDSIYPLMSMAQPVFIISDRSGLTAETMCHTLLTQFPDTEFRQTALPFVDSPEKIASALELVQQAGRESGLKPMVFVTFVDDILVNMFNQADIELFDLFNPFIPRIENALGQWPGGVTIAATHCRLYHLPFTKLQELEKEEPMLVVHLYKMLTYLMARKEVVTIDHLNTLYNILTC